MSEFNNFYLALDDNAFNELGSGNYAIGASKAAWNHQQAKIDELQGRIDGALNAVWNDKCSHTIIDILKGNKDEN